MSTIIVNAAALRSSGALTIYRQFIHYLPTYIGDDKYYIFVDPSMDQPSIKGVAYILDSNHSKLHYVWWLFFGLKKWLKKHHIIPSVIVSLQNIGTRTNYRQVIYYHQSIPLYKNKWSFLKPVIYSYLFLWFLNKISNPRIIDGTPTAA